MPPRKFHWREIYNGLGLAPATACVITNLLNGDTHPDNFRSLEPNPLKQFGAPLQHEKILAALCKLIPGEIQEFNGMVLVVRDGDISNPTVGYREGGFFIWEGS